MSDHDVAPGIRAVAFSAAVPATEAGAVHARLAALPDGEASPFARVPGTHLARIVLLDRLDPPELLLSALVDGEPGPWLEALHAALGERVDDVFGMCEGWSPGGDGVAFSDWALARRIEGSALIAGHPGATVTEIREAVRLARALRRFAAGAQDLDPGALRQRFLEAVVPVPYQPGLGGTEAGG